MFKEKTLLIVGAGASAEVGMPVGRNLSDIIRENAFFEFEHQGPMRRGNRKIYHWLRQKYPDANERNKRLHALRQIHDGIYLANSIDNYIYMHTDDECIAEVGKLAIAHAISEAEAQSSLFVDQGNINNKLDLQHSSVGNSWLDSFARILFEKVRRDDIEKLAKKYRDHFV